MICLELQDNAAGYFEYHMRCPGATVLSIRNVMDEKSNSADNTCNLKHEEYKNQSVSKLILVSVTLPSKAKKLQLFPLRLYILVVNATL